jgi:hypothetical protein
MRLHSLLGLAFAIATLLALSTVPIRAADPPPHAEHFLKCAKACSDCQLECAMCFQHCTGLLGQGMKEHVTTARTCADCGDVCALCATLCGRQSPFAATEAEACAKVCDDCAAACEKFPDHKMMVECAKSCRDCAKACKDMGKMLKP